jgi:chromosome segregation ATPase
MTTWTKQSAARYDAKLADTMAERDKYENGWLEAEGKLSDAEARIEELEAENRELALDVISANGQALDACDAQKAAEAKLDDKEAECRHLRGQVGLLKAKLAKAVEALDRIAHVSDIYGVEANAEDQGAGTLAYAHKSTCNLARAALAELEQKP